MFKVGATGREKREKGILYVPPALTSKQCFLHCINVFRVILEANDYFPIQY
jgi:hypothetical protein